MSEEIHGECRCGAVRFTIGSEPLVTMACHCTGCQRMTGSAFSLSSLFLSDGFRITAGETVIGGLQGAARHHFCPHCMSWLFTRPEGMDDFVNVRSAMLNDPGSDPPFIETWTREKLPWAVTGAAHSFETVPEPGRFPELLAAFANRAGAVTPR